SGLVSLGGQVIAHQPMTGPGGNAVAPKQSPLYSEFCVVVQICRQCAGPPDAICFEIEITRPGRFDKRVPCQSPEDIWFDDGMWHQPFDSAVKAVKIVASMTKCPVELSIHRLNHVGCEGVHSVALIAQRKPHGIEGARDILPVDISDQTLIPQQEFLPPGAN